MALTNTTLQEQPTNIPAERTVLGSILIDSNAINVVADLISAKHFYKSAHQRIFEAALALDSNDAPIDLVSVAEYLERKGQLEDVGGKSYLASLEMDVLTTQNVAYYCNLVRAAHVRREVINLSHRFNIMARDETITSAQVIEGIEQEAFNLSKIGDQAERGVRCFKDISVEEMDNLEKRSFSDEPPGLPMGFSRLDDWDFLAGLHRSDMTILAGSTGVGKTAFAINIISHVMSLGKPVLFFSLEQPARQVHNRLLALHSGISHSIIRFGTKDRTMLSNLISADNEISGCPLFIDDTPSLSTGQLRSRVRRFMAKSPDLSLVVVDYLQIMRLSGTRANMNRENIISEISHCTKSLAQEMDIPVIALAQINRTYLQSKSRTPGIGALRESGAIEQNADCIMFVHRHIDEPEDVEIIVAKQRNGRVGRVAMTFHGETLRFREKM